MISMKPFAKEINTDELYGYVKQRASGEKNFERAIYEMYQKNAKRSNILILVALRIIAFSLFRKANKKDYFFFGSKYEQIILGLPKDQVCVIGGAKQAHFCLKNGINYIEFAGLWKHFSRGLSGTQDNVNSIKKIILKASGLIQKKATKDAILVVDNDSLPMQRAIVLAGKIAGLKTVCVQHGVFQSKTPKFILDGWFADYIYVYNDHQKNMFLNMGMDANKVKVLGFYEDPYRPKRALALPENRKVCILGQPWGKYSEELGARYLQLVSTLFDALRKLGISCAFKPHPWEVTESYVSDIENIFKGGLRSALEDFDVFISFTSTALIEANYAGRIAVQIMDDVFKSDAFSVHGQIYVVDTKWGCDWCSTLVGIILKAAPEIDSPPPVIQRFSEVSNGIKWRCM